ncbi:MAG: BON domain-containing protein [Gammaproteobacteria bacterium]|nr:BON domain-containing protein [Gammaproteobacteria bacterium]
MLSTKTRSAALVVALFAGLIGCEHTPRTEAQKQADKAIAERVDSALQADRMLYAKHIIVHADNGVVRLTGYVWEAPDLTEAQRVARAVEGVTGVVNDLELQRNGLGDSPVSR